MRAATLVALVLVAAACNPYEKRSGEYYAGPVDPAAFAAPYRATPMLASAATAHGEPAPYYAFPAAPNAADAPIAPPVAYVFDPPVPSPQRCVPPAGYAYDARRDAYRLDQQGSIFTALPSASGYTPVVAEVPVTSNGEGCQSLKSEATLVTSPDVVVQTMPPKFQIPGAHATGVPDGKYLAWAIVDPGAEVRNPDGSLDPTSGLGPQRLGWFDHYLVAYLEGGYVPTTTVTLPGMNGQPDMPVVHVIAQNVYFPSQVPRTLPSGVVVPAAGTLGAGFDIVDARRGEPGYSPLCHVLSFVPADPLHPPTSAADIDATQLHDTGTFVWCLQVSD